MEESAEIKIAVLESLLQGLRENIALQAKEYERRLTELNHAHQNQIDRNAQYVSREAWELKLSEQESWRREVDRWRWIAVGAGIAGGGLTAIVTRLIAG